MSLFGKGEAEESESPGKEREESSTRATTTEGAEGNALQNLFTFGSQNQPFQATDYSDTYAEQKGYYLRFKHLPSGLTMSFKGFLTSFNDSYSSNWNQQSVYGRMDNIYTFQNTTRKINVGFVMPAFDEDDGRCNLTKVTKLVRKLYPYYSDGAGNNATSISKAPLMRIEFVNLIRDGRDRTGGLLGKVDGFSVTPNLDHGFFDYDNYLYPKTIDIGFTFDVLHEHIMGWTDGADENVTGTNLQWADGTANAFPYARASTNDPTTADTDTSTDQDDEADNAGFFGSILFSD